jgi:AraC-like DNA-binding protein
MDPTLITAHMRYWRMTPDPRLRRYVLCYFFARPREFTEAGEASRARLPAVGESELLLPDGHSEIVFGIDGAFERWQVGKAEPRSVMRHSYVIGSRSHSVLTRDLGPVTVAGVKLDPRALRRLIGIPLAEFRDSTLSFSDLGRGAPRRALADVEAAVACAGSPREVADALDRYLLAELGDPPPTDASVDELLRQIQHHRGALPIMAWARRRRIDARHLERRFAAAIGMTPKRYARIIRFKHSYRALVAGVAPAGIHLDGFYDQSHFNREFRAFIGAAPTARLALTMEQATSISDHLLAAELSPPSLGPSAPRSPDPSSFIEMGASRR